MTSVVGFSEEQVERYSRHILLQEIGGEGQRKLLRSRALMIGAGGLGAPALLYLAAAGVGKIGVVDGDVVELSNLQRQVIHSTQDLDKAKVISAQETMTALNPDCEVVIYPERLTAANLRQIISGWEVVLDGSDNFPTRFLVADGCWREKIPLVSAAAVRFQGQLMTILPGEGNPCYRCLFPEPPPPGLTPTCQEAGILGAVVGVMGSLQALEAIKVLLGLEGILSHRLMVYDALAARFMTVKRKPDPACPLCGKNPRLSRLEEYDWVCSEQEAPPNASS